MVTAIKNVKSPARRCSAVWAGPGTNSFVSRKEPVPVAVSVAGGVARPRLTVVGTNPGPGIDVHPINVEQLTASLNAIRTRVLPEEGEVTAFTTMLAAAVEQGRLAGLAEAGVA